MLIYCTAALLLLLSTFTASQEVLDHPQNSGGQIVHHEMASVDEGHTSCRTFHDCIPKIGLRSTCNNQGRCVCAMGFTEAMKAEKNPHGNGTILTKTCEYFNCKASNVSCHARWGFMSHCDLSDRCRCDLGYWFDSDKGGRGECTNEGHNFDTNYERHIGPNYLAIGLVAGGAVAIIVLLIVLICCCLKRKGKKVEERRQAVARNNAAHEAHRRSLRQEIPSAPVAANQQQNPGAYI